MNPNWHPPRTRQLLRVYHRIDPSPEEIALAKERAAAKALLDALRKDVANAKTRKRRYDLQKSKNFGRFLNGSQKPIS